MDACTEIEDSILVMLILRLILAAGNFLNNGANQGSAAGFQLETLLKLKDLRATKDKSFTLLHWVAR